MKAKGPAWVPCDSCDDMFCEVHQTHAWDCSCPPIDDWVEAGYDPYLSEITSELIGWLKANEFTDDE